jgi:WD40 repeat protein
VAISPDGKLLASASADRSIRLWSLPDGQLIKILEGHLKAVGAVCFSPDGKSLASGGFDKTVRLWSLPEGQPLKTLEGHTDYVTALAIGQAGRLLASASQDHTIRLLSLPDGGMLKSIPAHTRDVTAVAASPDGNLLASASLDGVVRLWNLPGGEPGPCLFDPGLVAKGTKARHFQQMGRRTVSLPCGSPRPAGTVCICDCVASSITYSSTKQVCVCDTISVPAGESAPGGATCVCDTIAVGTKPATQGPSGPDWNRGGEVIHYWYPN